MDQDTIRQHLERDLPGYEMVPESLDNEAAADETVQADTKAGSLSKWTSVPAQIIKANRPPRVIAPTAELLKRFK